MLLLIGRWGNRWIRKGVKWAKTVYRELQFAQRPTTIDILPVADDFLPTTIDILPVAIDLLPTTIKILPIANGFLPTTIDILPVAIDFLPTNNVKGKTGCLYLR